MLSPLLEIFKARLLYEGLPWDDEINSARMLWNALHILPTPNDSAEECDVLYRKSHHVQSIVELCFLFKCQPLLSCYEMGKKG